MSTVDKPVSEFNGHEFIPIACHYNKDTLLTKNGQLIQIFCIENAYKFGNHITLFYNVRKLLRQAIQTHVKSDKFAFWFSIVRDEVDLRVNKNYDIDFCNSLNSIWTEKHFWSKHYTNKLYVSVVYHHADLSITNFNSFINSFSQNFVNNFHDNYLQQAYQELSYTVDNLCKELEIFGARRLGITIKDGQYFSELENCLEKIFYIKESNSLLSEVDIAKLLEPQSYTVHHNHIEIEHKGEKKACAILALKQYQDISSELLDVVIQAPHKMTVTEIITFISKDQVDDELGSIEDIFNTSKADQMSQASGIKQIFQEQGLLSFVKQQINLCIIENTQEKLNENITQISQTLDKFGIVHVREDIDIEYAFWSRFPGNAHLVRRSAPALLSHCAAFSSIYNFPSGDRENIWGPALTILKTSGNTPYYFNFHDGDNGHGLICAYKGDGKAVLLNFLVSMSTQYNPQILYIYHSARSQIFLELLGAKIVDHLNLPNPLLFFDELEILQWLKMLCSDKLKALNDQEQQLLEKIAQYLMSLPKEERVLAKIANFDYSAHQNYMRIKERLELFLPGGRYQDIKFDATCQLEKIQSLNLAFFTAANFKIANYPKQEKLLPLYISDLAVHINVSAAVLFAMMKIFAKQANSSPKILVLTNLDSLVSPEHFQDLMPQILDDIRQNNGIVLSTMDMKAQESFEGTKFWEQFRAKQASIIALAGENIKAKSKNFLGFDDQEMQVLLNLPAKSRSFVIKQYSFVLGIKMNLNDYFYITKILSATEQYLKQYLSLKSSNDNQANFLNKLYEILQED